VHAPAAQPTSSDDDARIDTLADADASRFGAWVAPHWSVMTAFALRLADRGDADDIVQDALLTAWRRRATFDPRRGSPRTWLLTLTADSARRHWRRSRRVPVPVADAAPGGEQASLGGDDGLRPVLGHLSRRQRIAVELHYYMTCRSTRSPP
jgi:DNA-directed RNA polymerase specialized sigma24 family protein